MGYCKNAPRECLHPLNMLGFAANERTPCENSKEFFLSSWFELGGKNGEIPPVGGFSLSLSTDQNLFLGLATAVASHNLWGSRADGRGLVGERKWGRRGPQIKMHCGGDSDAGVARGCGWFRESWRSGVELPISNFSRHTWAKRRPQPHLSTSIGCHMIFSYPAAENVPTTEMPASFHQSSTLR